MPGKSYSGLVATELLVLLIIVVVATSRGRAFWYTVLGQTEAAKPGDRTPFAGPPVLGAGTPGVYRFTAVGLVIAAVVATKTARGAWGLLIAWFLAAVIVSMSIVNYRQFLSFIVTKGG